MSNSCVFTPPTVKEFACVYNWIHLADYTIHNAQRKLHKGCSVAPLIIGVGTGGGGGGGGGALAPLILGIMCIKYAEFILGTPDTPFEPPQSCLRCYASAHSN